MIEKTNPTQELNLAEDPDGITGEGIAALMRAMIEQIGEDPKREGLRHTPERFERALRYLTSGYHQDPKRF